MRCRFQRFLFLAPVHAPGQRFTEHTARPRTSRVVWDHKLRLLASTGAQGRGTTHNSKGQSGGEVCGPTPELFSGLLWRLHGGKDTAVAPSSGLSSSGSRTTCQLRGAEEKQRGLVPWRPPTHYVVTRRCRCHPQRRSFLPLLSAAPPPHTPQVLVQPCSRAFVFLKQPPRLAQLGRGQRARASSATSGWQRGLQVPCPPGGHMLLRRLVTHRAAGNDSPAPLSATQLREQP